MTTGVIRTSRSTLDLPKHPGHLNDSHCNSSSTEAGVLIAYHQATARPHPMEVQRLQTCSNTIEPRPRWPSDKVSTPGPEAAGSKPGSAVHGACCTPNHTQWSNIIPLVWRGSLEKGCKLRRRPRHPTVVQNYEVRP
ncbi:hypothetical protein AVEN_143417-1 [Araneus ventricosus]|uniref:Uncharacterized protein n=1 Tax=Araneus ventricosus TaxID=182803 RepID=A0A4Y2AE64_ARAVE|nr:hypothetical protein AVEN_143417-1 [Araneus ventricosus]